MIVDHSKHIIFHKYKDKYKDKDKTKTKCLKDPKFEIFLKWRGFKDIKYNVQTRLQSRGPNSRTCVLLVLVLQLLL